MESNFTRWGLQEATLPNPIATSISFYTILGIALLFNILDLILRFSNSGKRWIFRFRDCKNGKRILVINVFLMISAGKSLVICVGLIAASNCVHWLQLDADGSSLDHHFFVLMYCIWVPLSLAIEMIGVGVIVGELLAYERIMSAKVVLIISMLFKVAWITLSLPFLITLDAKSAEGYNLSRSIQKILNLGLSDQTNVKTMIIQLNKLETETLDSLRGLLLILLIGGVLITIAITGSITRRSIRFFCLFYTRAEMFKWKTIKFHQKATLPIPIFILLIIAIAMTCGTMIAVHNLKLIIFQQSGDVFRFISFYFIALCGSITCDLFWVISHCRESGEVSCLELDFDLEKRRENLDSPTSPTLVDFAMDTLEERGIKAEVKSLQS